MKIFKNMIQMTIAAISLLVGIWLVIDWYDNPTHIVGLVIGALNLAHIFLHFLTKVEYGSKADL